MKKICPTCKSADMAAVSSSESWCPICGTLIGGVENKAYVPLRSPYAQSLNVKEMATHFASGIHQGLLIVAADALERANKLLSTQGALPLVAEAISEALAAAIHELDAQGEDIAEIVVQIGDEKSHADPERLRDLLRRTLRRRRAK